MKILPLFRHILLVVALYALNLPSNGKEVKKSERKVIWPTNLCASIGTVSAEEQVGGISCWHDTSSGYYLYRVIDCDWAHVGVTLTKDRRMVANCGFEIPNYNDKKKDLPSNPIVLKKFKLATKNGVQIGMTREQVEKKLGKASRTAVRGGNKEYWCMLYKKAAMEDDSYGCVLRNTYIFKHDKLIEIAINLDRLPGCCEDALSDENWPWSKF
jgi:hypothetical protein